MIIGFYFTVFSSKIISCCEFYSIYQIKLLGYYGENFVCKSCNVNCKACATTSQNCTSCVSNRFLNIKEDGSGECVVSCSGYKKYPDANRICQNCPEKCTICLSLNECLECVQDYFLYDKLCVNTCKAGLYPYDNKCNSCPTIC